MFPEHRGGKFVFFTNFNIQKLQVIASFFNFKSEFDVRMLVIHIINKFK